MGFFDEIGKKISETASSSARKTKEFVEISKLNAQVSDEKHGIADLFMKIGEQYYNNNAANPKPEFELLFQEVARRNQHIIELQDSIQKVRNVRACPNCGAECAPEVSFCSSCGTALPTAAPADPLLPRSPAEAPASPVETPPAPKACAQCGTELSADAVFCTNCGNKIV